MKFSLPPRHSIESLVGRGIIDNLVGRAFNGVGIFGPPERRISKTLYCGTYINSQGKEKCAAGDGNLHG